MIDIVIDTNIFISGLLSPKGVPGKIIDLWERGGFDVVMSGPMLAELNAVLAYSKIKKRLQFTQQDIDDYCAIVEFKAKVINIENVVVNVPNDHNDDKILATFVAADADCLLTGDDDLLHLKEEYPILTPREFADCIW